LGFGQPLSETTRFPDGSELSYVLVLGEQCTASLGKTERGQEICIEVVKSEAQTWADSDEVGYGGPDPLQIGPLEILIEKDFTCITPREGEQELDTFPNPKTQATGVSTTS
jgi:hypothetical protein